MQLSAPALAVLKADLANAAALWKAVTLTEHVHPAVTVSDGELEEVEQRTATVVVESEPRGLVLIFTLEGAPGAPATSVVINFNGSTFETSDVELITLLEARAATLAPLAEGLMVAALTAPIVVA